MDDVFIMWIWSENVEFWVAEETMKRFVTASGDSIGQPIKLKRKKVKTFISEVLKSRKADKKSEWKSDNRTVFIYNCALVCTFSFRIHLLWRLHNSPIFVYYRRQCSYWENENKVLSTTQFIFVLAHRLHTTMDSEKGCWSSRQVKHGRLCLEPGDWAFQPRQRITDSESIISASRTH